MSPSSPTAARFCRAARKVAFFVLALAFFSAASRAAAAEPVRMDQALKENAPKILAKLTKAHAALIEKNGQLNVGAIKFLVEKGKHKKDDNAGPLNLRMADRLEVALILALKDARVRLLRDVSGTVVKLNPRANHTTLNGRKAFFDNKYRPAWGDDEPVAADVFVTGEVKFDESFKTATVAVEAFDKTGTLKELCTFTARVDARTLTEAGVSFQSRSLNVDDLELPGTPAKPETVEKEMPIVCEILYGKDMVPIKDGVVPEPKKDQEVTFVLRHRGGRDQHTYGVILKVNGDNTIFPDQKVADEAYAWKWVLAPGKEITVTGFQTGFSNTKKFKVAPVRPTDASTVRYSPHAGTFQLVVYRAKQPEDKDPVEKEPEPEVGSIARGDLDAKAPKGSLKSLQAYLKKPKPSTSRSVRDRGFIEPGDEAKGKVKEVPFKPFAKPVSSLTIRYYKPGEE